MMRFRFKDSKGSLGSRSHLAEYFSNSGVYRSPGDTVKTQVLREGSRFPKSHKLTEEADVVDQGPHLEQQACRHPSPLPLDTTEGTRRGKKEKTLGRIPSTKPLTALTSSLH